MSLSAFLYFNHPLLFQPIQGTVLNKLFISLLSYSSFFVLFQVFFLLLMLYTLTLSSWPPSLSQTFWIPLKFFFRCWCLYFQDKSKPELSFLCYLISDLTLLCSLPLFFIFQYANAADSEKFMQALIKKRKFYL